jgi:hypothetical protein
MKKTLLLCLAVLMLNLQSMPTYAAFSEAKKDEAKDELIKPEMNVGKANKEVLYSLTTEEILALTPNDYKSLTGKKLSFKERFVLKYAQRSIKKDLKKEGSVDIKRYFDDGDSRFNGGGFALGLLLGLLGVLLAHIFSSDKSFRRSSWYGFGLLVSILLVVSAVARGN